MQVSVDISMYPLHKEYEKPIIEFIQLLRKSEFHTEENGLSTQIFGEYLPVMEFLKLNIHETLLQEKNCVFTLKIVTNNRSKHGPIY